MRRCAQFLIALAILIVTESSSHAFALLGPFAPWMTSPLSYYQIPNAIGGPMQIGEGYRWNVPVITYGFDQSFLDYFGTNGVIAVQSAIQILNNFPLASQIDLSAFKLQTVRQNFNAEAENLVDLKSQTLVMLIEHLGLAQPTVFAWSLRNFTFDPANSFATYSVVQRNYDPTTLNPSPYVNGNLLDYTIFINENPELLIYDFDTNIVHSSMPAWPLLPLGDAYISSTSGQNLSLTVADYAPGPVPPSGLDGLNPGRFFSGGLTTDDAGGLAYLLSTNTIALESLLPDIHGNGTNATNFVNRALRPGVDKITFQPMVLLPLLDTFIPITNDYVDTYITNGVTVHQNVERIVTHPDIIFTAFYTGGAAVLRTGTTNWINNGAPGHDGPGVIQPPAVINFNRAGPSLIFGDGVYPPSYPGQPISTLWGSFNGTTNAPIVYSVQPATTNSTEFHFFLASPTSSAPASAYTWHLPGAFNSLVSLQTSTNLSNWIAIATLTNQGGTFTYEDFVFTNSPQRYFRTVPQQ